MQNNHVKIKYMAEDKKNTLRNESMTKPLIARVPPKNPNFQTFNKNQFKNTRVNTAFRSQNRGSGGK